ncbi:MAG TPA: alpha/beta hydrolase, partial [Candidatus Binatia bacterium]
MTAKITFPSDGLQLSGIVQAPEDLRPGERRPAFLVLHGFGGNKDGRGQTVIAEQLNQWGYVTMRFDFRGCGESGGERARILCLDQVKDTSSAISYMATRPEVDPRRIA